MSAYDNDPRVTSNPDGTVTVTAVNTDGEQLRVTYDPADGSADGLDEAVRSLIGEPK